MSRKRQKGQRKKHIANKKKVAVELLENDLKDPLTLKNEKVAYKQETQRTIEKEMDVFFKFMQGLVVAAFAFGVWECKDDIKQFGQDAMNFLMGDHNVIDDAGL